MTEDHYKLIRLTCVLGFLLVALGCRIIYLLYPQQ